MIKVKQDLTGMTFGRLTVVKQVEDYIFPSGCKDSQWLCMCSCGNTDPVLATGKSLRAGDKLSCGCLLHTTKENFIDMTGWKMWEHGVDNSRITVIKQVEDYISPSGIHCSQWECTCSCGNPKSFKVIGQSLRAGNTLSCGCYHKEHSSQVCKKRNISQNQNRLIDKGDYYEVYDNDNNMFIIDKEDKELVSQTYWAKYNANNYFKSSIDGKNVWLHRFLENALKGEYVDHKNNDFNDYRKCNLRICDNSENNRNIGLKKNKTSGVTGVSWDKRLGKWRARGTIYGEEKQLGVFDKKEDAIAARREAEDKYFGDFSYRKSQEDSTYVQ